MRRAVYPVGAYRRLRGSGSRTPVGRRTPAPRTVECPRGRPGGTRRDRVPALAPRARGRRGDDALRRPPPAAGTRVRVVHFPRRSGSTSWCRRDGVERGDRRRLLRARPVPRRSASCGSTGAPSRHEPVAEPYAARRACVVSDGDGRAPRRARRRARAAARRPRPGRPAAGRRRRARLRRRRRPRGLLAPAPGSSTPTSPTAATRARRSGSPPTTLIAVACDGRRSGVDAGLSMLELAEVMIELGAESAINLDGGGSTTLVHRGHLLNRPYSTQDQPAPESRRIVSALAFEESPSRPGR